MGARRSNLVTSLRISRQILAMLKKELEILEDIEKQNLPLCDTLTTYIMTLTAETADQIKELEQIIDDIENEHKIFGAQGPEIQFDHDYEDYDFPANDLL